MADDLDGMNRDELMSVLSKMRGISVRAVGKPPTAPEVSASGELGEITAEDIANFRRQLADSERYKPQPLPPKGEWKAPMPGFPLVPTQREAGEPGKPLMEAIGSTGASLLALPPALASRNPTLPIAAGALGTAGADYLYDVGRDVRRKFVDDPTIPPTASERLYDPIASGVGDAAWGTAVGAIPGVANAARGLRRGLMGVNPEQADLGRTLLGNDYMAGTPGARPLISAGIADLGENRGRTVVKTLGQMPWMGGPAASNRAKKLADYDRVSGQYLGLFGPDRSVPELGEGLRAGVERGYDAFRNVASGRYNMARMVADAAGDILPSGPLRNAAADGVTRMLQDAPRMASGQAMAPASPAFQNRVTRFLSQLDELPPQIGVQHLDWLSTELNNLQDMAKNQGLKFDVVDQVRRAARDTMRNSAHPAAQALVQADDFFARGMSTFETTQAQKASRVDKNMFRLGHERPGMLNDQDLYSIVRGAKSPQAIDQIENMLAANRTPRAQADARALMGSLARRYVTEALQGAQTEVKAGQHIIDVNKLEDTLHLRDRGSAEYQTISRLLRSAGQDMNDFRRFAEITRAVYGNEVPDVSTYMARRAAFGGSMMGALSGHAVASGHTVAQTAATVSVLPILLGRYATSIATRPSSLRALIRTYDSNMPEAVKRTNYIRILQGLSGEKSAEERAQEIGLTPKVAGGGEQVQGGTW